MQFRRARFDLLSVRDALAQLPDKRLEIKLFFSNGLEENWHLGRETVEALKELPTIRQALLTFGVDHFCIHDLHTAFHYLTTVIW